MGKSDFLRNCHFWFSEIQTWFIVSVHGFKGSGFKVKVKVKAKVKDKEGIKDPKFSLKMLISQNYCQFGSNFWIRLDEVGAFLVNTHPKCSPASRMEPLNL
jgi:hypothetical protein